MGSSSKFYLKSGSKLLKYLDFLSSGANKDWTFLFKISLRRECLFLSGICSEKVTGDTYKHALTQWLTEHGGPH